MTEHTVAQLAHVEILSPKPQESVAFFKDLLGMQESARSGGSVYLRGYQDTYHHSLVVTEAAQAGMGRTGWRTSSAAALEQIAAGMEATGLGMGWIDDEIGQGRTYRFRTPDDHVMEVAWELEPAPVPSEEASAMPNAPQMRPLQGVPVRRIDHVNLMCSDVPTSKRFFEEHLSFKCRERVVMEGDEDFASWFSVSPLPHELAIMTDTTGTRGRLHHVAFWYGVEQHLNDIAEILRDRGIAIEAGPSKHGITQSPFIYVYEPGGNRIELFGGYGYLCLAPDFEQKTWTPELLSRGLSMYGLELPETFFAYGTPHVEISADDLVDGVHHRDTPQAMPAS
jgi:catechol 2,3-dioxygenase